MRRFEYEGRRYKIECLVLANGSCPAGEFLDGLGPADRRKLDVLFEKLADHGRIWNREQFKKLEDSDNIWEFKSGQIRLYCFFTRDGRVMLEFGLWKKRGKHRRSDLDRAEGYRSWFMSRGEEVR